MVTLHDVANGATAIPIGAIRNDEQLAKEIQSRLSDVGLLDPPSDGKFGEVSHWAFGNFMERMNHDFGMGLDRDLAAKLLSTAAEDILPVRDVPGLARRLLKALDTHGHWICRHPDAVNIVYVEGISPDGTLNDNKPNRFNDVRIVLRVDPGANPEILGLWDGTTEPGRKWTLEPMGPKGAARSPSGNTRRGVSAPTTSTAPARTRP